jgi:glycosyltransferase involved in cell wall biosynthesis
VEEVGMSVELEKELPMVAVLISVYKGDRANWFREAFQSIIGQNYPSDKIRIYLGVDGPVTEDVDAAIQEYRDKIWKLVRASENIRLPKILNKLIRELGDEEYVFRMDSDDVCEKDRFQAQIKAMEKDDRIGVLGTAIREFDVSSDDSVVRTYPLDHEILKRRMYLGLPVAHPSVCFRRTALDVIKGYDERALFSQDAELWFRAMSMGIRFANLEKPYLRFRCNRDTLRRRSIAKARQELKYYVEGCRDLYGTSPKLLFPYMRFGIRLLPIAFIRFIYGSKLRHWLLEGSTIAKKD